VARNEDGEFELMLGNKQLLSVFFLMVLLLCLCFVGGYLLGRSAAPVLNASNDPPAQEIKPLVVPPVTPAPEPVQASTPAPQPDPAPAAAPPVPTKTAPMVSEKAPEPAKEAPKSTAKATPPPPKATTPAKASASSQPVPGRIYLQLSATDKDKADVMVDLLRRKNLPGIAASISERPGLYRVLVGPVAENALPDMKAKLKANGFPADQAMRRVF